MKHAYLIMAHNEINLLKLLIHKLDHKNNDIFLHLDVKCEYDPRELLSVPSFSRLFLVRRQDVSWGGYSQIRCEMLLLEEAVKGKYDYYHLLTGVDLPIKPVEEIHAFFEKNRGFEFIDLDDIQRMPNHIFRYDHWHLQPDCIIKNKSTRWAKYYNRCVYKAESLMNTYFGNRSKKYTDIVFRKGSVYFDITHEFAAYLVANQRKIRKMFQYTKCCDEIFLQTLAFNSSYKDKIKNHTRFIDWSKDEASPAILTLSHYDAIISSSCLFARKFSEKKSRELIEKLIGSNPYL